MLNATYICKRKSQMKIQQSAFMLLALTLFFVLGGLFFLAIKVADVQKNVILQDQERAISLVNKLSRTSELGCGGRLNCLDMDKLMVMKNRQEYKDYWNIDTLIVRKLYPESEEECNSENYPDCGIIKIFSDKNAAEISTYIALCKKTRFKETVVEDCDLGLLMVEIENEE